MYRMGHDPSELTEYQLGELNLKWNMYNESNDMAYIKYTKFGEVSIKTPLLNIKVTFHTRKLHGSAHSMRMLYVHCLDIFLHLPYYRLSIQNISLILRFLF